MDIATLNEAMRQAKVNADRADLRARSYGNRAAPVYCKLRLAGNATLTTAVPLRLSFTLEDVDTDGLHSNSGGSNQRITIPVGMGGLWRLKVSGDFSSSSSVGTRKVEIRKNGATTSLISNTQAAVPSAQTTVGIEQVVVADPGDYFEMWVTQDSGANLTLVTSVGNTYFEAERVGDVVGTANNLNVSFDSNIKYKGLNSYAVRLGDSRITIVDDPILGPKRQVLRMHVRDTDIPTGTYPRAQLQSPDSLAAGSEVYAGFGLYLPTDFPDFNAPDWFMCHEIYGSPFNSTGPMGMGVEDGLLHYRRNATYGEDRPWSIPVAQARGKWVDIVFGAKLSTDPAVGWVEMWVNTGTGLTNVLPRLPMLTLDTANNGAPNFSSLKLARSGSTSHPGGVVAYYANHKVATTAAAADPKSYA